MNTQLEMFLKTGILLIILQTVHSVVEKRTNRTCMGYHSLGDNLVNKTTMENEKDLSGIREDTGSSESSIVLDPHVSTTQNYENSKLLFNYIVPVNSEPSKIENKKEENEDDEDDGDHVDEEEEEEEVEEEEAAATEDEEDEEEDEEEEYRKRDLKEEDENARIEDHEVAQDDQNEHVTAEEEEEGEKENERNEGEEEEEYEEEKEEEGIRSASDHEDNEENQHEEEAEEEDSGQREVEEKTEQGTTSAPIIPWRHSYPTLMREVRPRLDFTTAQPYEDPRPVSYSSVVYDPVGHSKTELSGSFYRKPLKLIPRSKLFGKQQLENVSEDTKTIHVTTSPVVEERSIQASVQEENEDDFDSVKRDFEGRPMRVLNIKVPRHSFDWSLPKTLEDEESKNYNEKTRQKYHDKSNREKYYEQVINTRFGAKEKGLTEGDENYESEVQDLMKPQTEWKHETVQKEVLSEEDEIDSGENYKPTNKDRNQLYEYVVENMPSGQRTSENKPIPQTYTTTTPKRDEIPTTVPQENKTAETITVKPYSFGTITKSNEALIFNNPDNSDILYNQIVSDIQSMFTPSTPKPTNYEQHFLPSHGHCRTSPPNHDSANYETFIQPSNFQHGQDEQEQEDEEEDEEEEENPMPKRLPMKTYIIKRKPVKKPSGVKVTVYPVKSRPHMMYREAKPVSFRNSVYSGPVPKPNTLVRKIFYYEPKQKVLHYSPTNQILRIVRPQTTKFKPQPSGRMVIIRKL